MSETNYWSELSKDIAGATSSGLEAFFKEIAKIQDDFVNGKITHTTVVAAAIKFEALALFMDRTRESVLTSQAALGEALTPSQQSFDRRRQQTIQELKSVSQIWRQADTVAAVRNFGANAAKSFGLIGQILTISEVGDALITVDGQALSAQNAKNAKKVSANTYKDNSTGWTFFKGDVQTDGTTTFVISKEGARNSSITVRNWKSGQMGINLSDTQEEAPTGLSVFKGDQRPFIYGVDIIDDSKPSNTYAWSKVSWNTAHDIGRGDAEHVLWRDGRTCPMVKNYPTVASNDPFWEMAV